MTTTTQTSTTARSDNASGSPPASVGGPGVAIVVNGSRHVVDRRFIHHATVARLAFPAARADSFTVAFRGGPGDRSTGFLVPGHGTPIVEDQVFHVAAAVQS